ncbi:alpha-glucosidase, partial [termite gut metagenome]
TMPKGAKAWFTQRAQSVYEFLPFQDWKGESERPLLLELPKGLHVLLTEAEMVNYARTKFALAPDKPNTITGVMYGNVDDIAPYQTPWRVIMAAEQPGQLIENNDLLLNLNAPCEIENTWWIRPGKVMREVTLTTEGAKSVVDYAVKHNLQYMLFDAGWYGPEGDKSSDAVTVTIDPARNKNPNALNLKEVIGYAKQRNIGVILYVNQRALYQQLDEILPLYKSWGVSGIKFGFVQVGSQFWTNWMHEAVRKCAEYGLMVDIHDEYRPTGFSRTYPNLMTQEGIYGNEEFPDATHNVTLPFTRFTQGAADYTICYYRQKWDKNTQADTGHGLVNARLIKTTSAHQLAMAVVYYSPLQHLYWYDKPSDSHDEPELEFFDRVP